VVRPLGAILIGVYADKCGRKAALTLTIMMMALDTLIIAIAPPYTAIGIGAPIMLLVGRVVQGFSAGGEIGGAAAFLVEHAPKEKKGTYASWLQASMAICNILGALVAFGVTKTLTVEQINAGGWRIPFVIGLLIAPVGMWIRSTLDETPQFQKHVREHGVQKAPLAALFREAPLDLLKGTCVGILWVVATTALVVFMPVYVQRAFKVAASDAFIASLVGNVFMVVTCVAAGSLSDRIGRKTVLMIAAVLLALGVHPLLWAIQASQTVGTAILVQTGFCILTGLFVGVAPAALSELFPTRFRATGMSLCYTIAITFFGGFAPAILTWLAQNQSPTAPAWYVTASAVVALIAIPNMKPSED
jgi:MFS transporter, MHS family, proline/betaine transporter